MSDAVSWRGRFLEMRTEGIWEYAARVREIAGAAILAIDGDAVILVEQYRVPLGCRSLELPAGLVGDEAAGEAIEAAAGRELEEETGFRAERLVALGEFASSPGLTSERFTLVRATGLAHVSDGGGVDGEDIVVHRVRLAELEGFVAAKRAQGVSIDVRLLLLLGGAMLGPDAATG